jgi:hypothetical protein
MPVKIDPTKPIQFSVRIDSPTVVAYEFAYVTGGASTVFGKGTDHEAANPTGHTYTFGPVPVGTKILYNVSLAGAPNNSWRVVLQVMQNSTPLSDGQVLGSGHIASTGTSPWNGSIQL